MAYLKFLHRGILFIVNELKVHKVLLIIIFIYTCLDYCGRARKFAVFVLMCFVKLFILKLLIEDTKLPPALDLQALLFSILEYEF